MTENLCQVHQSKQMCQLHMGSELVGLDLCDT